MPLDAATQKTVDKLLSNNASADHPEIKDALAQMEVELKEKLGTSHLLYKDHQQLRRFLVARKLKLDETKESLEAVTKVCDVAGKEYAIEQALDKMEGEWKGVDLEIVEYRETGTYVLKGFDEIQQLLDDHIVMTQVMMDDAAPTLGSHTPPHI